ncbi:MAG: CbrC family protein [Pseudomonadota bacterium]
MSDKPYFRFHPGAYERGEFTESDETCAVCKQACGWKFEGLIYAELDDDPIVCARCLAEGRLESVAPGYGLHDMDFESAPRPEFVAEIEKRTPGFSTWNAFTWPVRDGVPLAFVGYGADAAFKGVDAVTEAVTEAFAAYGVEEGNPTYALVFKTLEGEAYVAVVDYD